MLIIEKLMIFEWDEKKNKVNKKKHGILFDEACLVFMDPYHITVFDPDHSHDDEERWITIGKTVRQGIIIIIHTDRSTDDKETVLRIISARKANKFESAQYSKLNGGKN